MIAMAHADVDSGMDVDPDGHSPTQPHDIDQYQDLPPLPPLPPFATPPGTEKKLQKQMDSMTWKMQMINKHIQIYVVAGDNNVDNWNQTLSFAMSWHHTATLSIKLTERIKAEAIKKARLGFLQSTVPLDLDRFDSTVHSSCIDDMDVILRAQVTNAYGINTK
jgi:hypothetical protein